jgi:RNase P subunit RPR2
MGRFDHEKKAASWGRGGTVKPQKIGSPKKAKANLCKKCHCSPCKQRFECRRQKQASGKTKSSCLGCAVILVLPIGGIIYGAYELVAEIIL